MRSLFFLAVLTCTAMAQASTRSGSIPGCTPWLQKEDHSCAFAGEQALVWVRNCSDADEEFQCENLQPGEHHARPCLSERVCHPVSPSEWSSDYSEWVEVEGYSCADNDNPVLWQRASTWSGVHTRACTSGSPPQ